MIIMFEYKIQEDLTFVTISKCLEQSSREKSQRHDWIRQILSKRPVIR